MDPSDIQEFIAGQDAVADPDMVKREKRLKYLIYHRKGYEISREQALAKRKAAYQPTGRKVGMPRLPRE